MYNAIWGFNSKRKLDDFWKLINFEFITYLNASPNNADPSKVSDSLVRSIMSGVNNLNFLRRKSCDSEEMRSDKKNSQSHSKSFNNLLKVFKYFQWNHHQDTKRLKLDFKLEIEHYCQNSSRPCDCSHDKSYWDHMLERVTVHETL